MTAAAQLEHLPLAALTPYAKNARTHSAAQLAQLVASLQQFGFTNPILIDAQGGIIAGHGRFLAAQQLGLATVPCLRLAHLSEVQKRAYILADNRLALNAGWDESLLGLELAALQLDDFNLDLIGFDAEELAGLLGAMVEPLDEMPTLADGDKAPFQQMTFTLHDDQAEIVATAIAAAKRGGPFVGPNENSNGNALARICAAYQP